MSRLNPSGRRGFTLIELLVAAVIAGILASIAYPAFTSYVQRSRRSDATALLTAVVQAQERYRSNRSAYASSADDLDITVSRITPHYTLSLAGVGNPAGFASGYVATATVKAGSPQTNDKMCASLTAKLDGGTLSYLAVNSSGADSSTSCWPR
jgi:type IV pilus assembly protein PilE